MNLLFYERIWAAILANLRIAPPYIASFDSASAMLRATAAYLRGQDSSELTAVPPFLEPLVVLLNGLPRPFKEAIYANVSASEGIPTERLGQVSGEAVAQWIVSEYPQREYPAVALRIF